MDFLLSLSPCLPPAANHWRVACDLLRDGGPVHRGDCGVHVHGLGRGAAVEQAGKGGAVAEEEEERRKW